MEKDNKKDEKRPTVTGKDTSFDRAALEDLLKRRFFYTQSFSIYGGVKGLYDYGPPGCAVKNNLLQAWRQHFILEENMLEIEATALTPEIVLKTSGHVDKFQDLMVKDLKTGECFRADHLLEEGIEKLLPKENNPDKKKEMLNDAAQADAFSPEELGERLKKYNIKAPETGNEISPPFAFNLMFGTQIGPTGTYKGFMRPETAQGIFVNFKRLLDYNGGKLPFAGATVGPAFRNEISPRAGLLRVREFTLAEIEHFVNPEDKSHPKYKSHYDVVLRLYPRDNQLGDKQILEIKMGDAVTQKIIANETLGYFLARTQLFLEKIGVKKDKLRFRQHLRNEMAHYACDCWDAEIQSSYGWIECVGCADRSAYDLSVHTAASGEKLTAFIEFPEGPKMMEIIDITTDKSKIGKQLRGDAKKVFLKLEDIKDDQKALGALFDEMEKTGKVKIEGVELTKDLISFKKSEKKVVGRQVIPSVIEPSFGIGRILYSLFEHAYWVRPGGDASRAVLSFKPIVAPLKCSLLPVIATDNYVAICNNISKMLTAHNISSKVDDSGVTIGRKYARTDEIGIPFGITVDDVTEKDNTVTFRERDSTKQVRVPIKELPDVIRLLINEETTWTEVSKKYPHQESKEEK